MSAVRRISCVLPSQKNRVCEIVIGSNLGSEVVRTARASRCARVVVVTDENLKTTHASMLKRRLVHAHLETMMLTIPSGEQSKNQAMKSKLEHAMLKAKCGRDTVIVALGGGVVGDLAGFVAATYMRGIPYIQVPTTLLAMVDSAIGGKTGIDTPYGKNLLGSIWQPKLVAIDFEYLKTLPQTELHNGLLEAVKVFLVMDALLLPVVRRFFQTHSREDLLRIIARAVELKVRVVTQDETEEGMRMVLNFGHTVGHVLERLSNYRLKHGTSIGIGMLVESKIAELLGVLSPNGFQRVFQALEPFALPIEMLGRFSVARILSATRTDKKARSGRVRYVLLSRVGEVLVRHGQYAQPVVNTVVATALRVILSLPPPVAGPRLGRWPKDLDQKQRDSSLRRVQSCTRLRSE